MKILWVSLVKFPPLCEYLQENVPSHRGLLYSAAKSLMAFSSDIHLGVVIGVKKRKYSHYTIDNIDYYLIPAASIDKCTNSMVNDCKAVISDFIPDLIHIYGTEYSMALAMAKANMKRHPIIASIQGLASVYERYADGFIPFIDKCLNITVYDFFRNTFLMKLQNNFKKRGTCEKQVIRLLTHITGRTAWDKVHALAINPSLIYYHMEEVLRDNFYKGRKWNFSTCNQHTIFVSNSNEPLKGAHNVIKSLSIILRVFPDTKVYFVGKDIFSPNIKTRLSLSGYNLYLKRLINSLNLQNHVKFLGNLSAEEMKSAFLSAHVYVLPSAIENSPNSLCEAQILGVPAIGAFCGGVPDMIENSETGYLYRYSEYEMLADLIIQIFNKSDLQKLSSQEISAAQARHDKVKNVKRLVDIYETITGCRIG